MKKSWKVVIKVIDAIVWFWSKIKPALPELEDDKVLEEKGKKKSN